MWDWNHKKVSLFCHLNCFSVERALVLRCYFPSRRIVQHILALKLPQTHAYTYCVCAFETSEILESNNKTSTTNTTRIGMSSKNEKNKWENKIQYAKTRKTMDEDHTVSTSYKHLNWVSFDPEKKTNAYAHPNTATLIRSRWTLNGTFVPPFRWRYF